MQCQHRKKAETTTRPCSVCGKLLQKHNFFKHMSVHFGERKYKCKECEMSFKFNDNLKVRKWQRIKKFKYLISRASFLQNHMKTHTDERNFQCHICPERFRTKGNLSAHIKNKHENTKNPGIYYEKPAKCGVCDYSTDKHHLFFVS